MNRLMIPVVLAILGGFSPRGASAEQLHFKAAGFSIKGLEAKPAGVTYQTLMMFLPGADGFSPNVNVQIQPFTGTIRQYTALSRKQFADAKFKVLKEVRQGKSAAVLEYTGEFNGRKLHWYARAIANGKSVFLATATASATQWKSVASQLKSCVDSFKVN